MRRIARVMSAILFTAVFAAGVGHADPQPDPHMPNPQAGYCPGGGMGSMIYAGFCGGERYPDGTYWHYIQHGIPMIGHPAGLLSPGMQCVLDNGSPVPPPAPPGGCGGAVPAAPPPS